MNNENRQKNRGRYAGKECAFIAVFVALLLVSQICFSAIPGLEVVTALFAIYALSFGVFRSCLAGTAFSLLRQLIFGFFPSVLILYLVYYILMAIVFGALGKRACALGKTWILTTVLACVCTVCFTLLDDVITPWFYGFSAEATQAYFVASLPIMATQTVCVGVSTALLFPPLWRVFRSLSRSLSTKTA
ncbi:MAG: hypothetical protein J6A38_06020 [Clostridia bacterium]|nr:hypothetical protein [Clostridia bacterium]